MSVWHVPDPSAALVLLQHQHLVTHVRFAPDSRLIVTATEGGTVDVSDIRIGLPVGPVLRHSFHVTALGMSANGLFATSGKDIAFRLWRLPVALETGSDQPIEKRLESLTGLTLSEAGTVGGT